MSGAQFLFTVDSSPRYLRDANLIEKIPVFRNLIEELCRLRHLKEELRRLWHLMISEAETEEVVIKDESHLRDLRQAKLIEDSEAETEEVVIKDESHLRDLRPAKLIEESEAETEEVVIKIESPLGDLRRAKFIEGLMLEYLLMLRAHRRMNTKLSKQKPEGTWSDQSLALLITVMGLFAGAAYMVLFSFHDAFPISAAFKGVNLSIWELLTFPRAATENFLGITIVTTTFILSMGMNTIAICVFFRKFVWGTFLTILSLFTIGTFSLSFFAVLSKFVPHHITIAGGNLKVPATFIVIFYDIYVILLLCAFPYAAKWWWSSRRKQDADVGALV